MLVASSTAAYGDVADPPATVAETLEHGGIARQPGFPERFAALLERAERQRGIGDWAGAEQGLRAAADLARRLGRPMRAAVAELALGELLAAQGQAQAAEPLLAASLAAAKQAGSDTLEAAAANALGNLAAERGRDGAAQTQYRAALAAATRAGDRGLEGAARLNLARYGAAPAAVLKQLGEAERTASMVADRAERAGLLLAVAEAALDLPATPATRRLAQASIKNALSAADPGSRLRGRLLALLAGVREAQDRPAAAIDLLERAVLEGDASAHELLYQWQWQLGRLRRDQGDVQAAIGAYGRAVGHLQEVRPLIPITYRDGRSSFRATLGPLYLAYAELLLRPGAGAGELRRARDIIELFKLDEIRDYLQDACITPAARGIEQVLPAAAVIYPISFPDRLDLLLSIGSSLSRETVPIGRDELVRLAGQLSSALRLGGDPRASARALHDVLIAPVLGRLDAAGVSTLVFVPDGALRQVPLAAIEGPDGFLLQRFAVVTAPSLSLIAGGDSAQPGRRRALLAGLSRPGPVVDELPDWWVDARLAQARVAGPDRPGTPSPASRTAERARGFEPSVPPRRERPPAAPQPTREAVAAALALPGAAQEVQALAELLPSRMLLDDGFVLRRFKQEIASERYDTVHIASHGLFSDSPEESFLVAYDGKLGLDVLAEVLRGPDPARHRIDLLVLSACETAEGDDRAPLGLSGVALDSGARSVLGSLWNVDDNATRILMQAFYERLAKPGTDKATALQQAQLSLMSTPAFRHPRYWAPFVLIGNPG